MDNKSYDEIGMSLDEYYLNPCELNTTKTRQNKTDLIGLKIKKSVKYMFRGDLDKFKRIVMRHNLSNKKCNNMHIINIACFNKKYKFVAFLLEQLSRKYGDKIDKIIKKMTDKKGRCIQHYTALSRDSSLLDLITSYNLDINCCDVDGDSPLHYAVINGDVKMVKKLLKYGANYKIRNKNGITPYECSVNNKRMLSTFMTCISRTNR